jgi:hypothetical protein
MPPKAKDSPARKRVPKEPKEPKEKGAGKAKKEKAEEKAVKEEQTGECTVEPARGGGGGTVEGNRRRPSVRKGRSMGNERASGALPS